MDQQRPQFFVTPLMEVSVFSYLWIRAGLLTWETFNILSRNKFHQIHKFMQYLLFHGTADNGVTIFYRYLNGSSFLQLPKITFWQNFLPSPGHLKALPAATCYQIPKPMPHIYFFVMAVHSFQYQFCFNYLLLHGTNHPKTWHLKIATFNILFRKSLGWQIQLGGSSALWFHMAAWLDQRLQDIPHCPYTHRRTHP